MKRIVGTYSSILYFGIARYRELDVDIGVQGDGMIIRLCRHTINGIQVRLLYHIDRQIVTGRPFIQFITVHSLDELDICVVVSGN